MKESLCVPQSTHDEPVLEIEGRGRRASRKHRVKNSSRIQQQDVGDERRSLESPIREANINFIHNQKDLDEVFERNSLRARMIKKKKSLGTRPKSMFLQNKDYRIINDSITKDEVQLKTF